jgi:hypothetical protein
MATVSLTTVQRQMLAWLWRQHYLAEDPDAANYAALLRVFPMLTAPKSTAVKGLEAQRLVRVRYAPDGPIQAIRLTEAGFDEARTI